MCYRVGIGVCGAFVSNKIVNNKILVISGCMAFALKLFNFDTSEIVPMFVRRSRAAKGERAASTPRPNMVQKRASSTMSFILSLSFSFSVFSNMRARFRACLPVSKLSLVVATTAGVVAPEGAVLRWRLPRGRHRPRTLKPNFRHSPSST